MPFIRKLPRFDPGVIRPNGVGCLVCGDSQGECFDTGVTLEHYGRIDFCATHAREFGLARDMVDAEALRAVEADAAEKLADAEAMLATAANAQAEAAKDREVIERLLARPNPRSNAAKAKA